MTVPNLDRLLTLEQADRIPDGAGGQATVWTALGRLWAELRPEAGDESAADLLTVSRARYRITVRASPPGAPSRPTPEQRFREANRVFRILAVSDRNDRGRYLTCLAEEETLG